MEERYLVKRAKRGDVDAFGELYKAIYKKLYAYALYTLKQSSDAEDVVSDTVTDAFAAIGQLKKDESFANWIFQILYAKCKRKMRDYYRGEQELPPEDSGTQDNLSDESWNNQKEEQLDVKAALMKLTVEEREIISMHIFFGYKTREIATFMEQKESTVRSKESRAIKKMKKYMDGKEM